MTQVSIEKKGELKRHATMSIFVVGAIWHGLGHGCHRKHLGRGMMSFNHTFTVSRESESTYNVNKHVE